MFLVAAALVEWIMVVVEELVLLGIVILSQ
jgi:hypothetical protein